MSKGQKIILFLLVFAGTVGVLRVDEAYSDMMDRDGLLTVTLRRVDEENIRVSAFGNSAEINAREVAEGWEQIQARVTESLDQATSSVRQLLGLSEDLGEEESQLRTVVFPVQTL